MKVVALSVPFPGAKRPLEEGAKLGMWEYISMGEKGFRVPDGDVYIFGAWHQMYESCMGLQGIKGVMWTSSAGEMDFTPVERSYLTQLLRDPRIEFIWFGDESLAEIYPEKGFYAPYPMKVDGIEVPQVEKRDIATLFCPTGPKKNILNQLLAMKLVQRQIKLTLHTNVVGYDEVLREMDCVVHGWLPQVEYYGLLASAKVNLACSWCETFNYNVAEAALLGTISVVSPTIPIHAEPVENVNSPCDIYDSILGLLETTDCVPRHSVTDIRALSRRSQEILSEKLGTLAIP